MSMPTAAMATPLTLIMMYSSPIHARSVLPAHLYSHTHHTCTHVCTHAHTQKTHKHTHTHTHTHIHTHTHTRTNEICSGGRASRRSRRPRRSRRRSRRPRRPRRPWRGAGGGKGRGTGPRRGVSSYRIGRRRRRRRVISGQSGHPGARRAPDGSGRPAGRQSRPACSEGPTNYFDETWNPKQ